MGEGLYARHVERDRLHLFVDCCPSLGVVVDPVGWGAVFDVVPQLSYLTACCGNGGVAVVVVGVVGDDGVFQHGSKGKDLNFHDHEIDTEGYG